MRWQYRRERNVLQGKVAIITGGAGALGGGVVEAFAAAGAHIAVFDRGGEHLDVLAQRHPDILPMVVDLLDASGIAAAVEQVRFRFGSVDVLAHLAGGWYGARVEETPPDQWRAQLDLNLTTSFLMAHAVLPVMLEQRSGVLLAVGSRPAVGPAAGNAAYAVAKLGVIKLMQTIDEEHRQDGIRANVILPSVIDTPANRRAMPKADASQWVKPAEIAAVLRFLASDDACIISGAVVPVYGQA